ncbi:MAG TPA: hypothetical protein DIC42_00105 [Holosporales bacterium]|nr:hypothetical protein [Holosporales bacterium]
MNILLEKPLFFLKQYANLLNIFKSGYKPFHYIHSSPWPGEIENVYSVLRGYLIVHGAPLSITDVMRELTTSDNLNATESIYIHGFAWLKDLRSMNENAVRRIARKFILQWIEYNKKIKIRHKNNSIAFAVMGERVTNWIIFFDFFGLSADEKFLGIFYTSLHTQISFLEDSIKKTKDPSVLSIGLKGLILAYVATNSLKKLNPTLDLFIYACKEQLSADGSHVSSDAAIHFNLLKDILDIRSALRSAALDGYEILTHIIQKMAPILRFSRLGDGKLLSYENPTYRPLANLQNSPSSLYIDMVLSIADVKGKQLIKAEDMGFERLNSKTSQLFVNVLPRKDDFEQFYGPGTGILNFEWNHAAHRIVPRGDIVIQTTQDEWLHCQKGSDIPQVLHIDRKSKNGQYLLEADFESILKKHNTTIINDGESYVFHHHRQLFLGDDDGDFRGQDRFLLSTNALCAVRFVFAKGISLSLINSSKAHCALIKIHEKENNKQHEEFKKEKSPHKNKLWRFMCQNAEELSVHHDEKTQQSALIVLTKLQIDKPTLIKWGFRLVQS